MTISEACQLWIEQRIDEELQERDDTGKSLRAIGRDIAAEIERIFEARVNPETIKSRVLRKSGGSNEPEEENQIESTPNANLEKLEKPGRAHGGARPGAGRKPAATPTEPQQHQVCTEAMQFATIAISQLERIRSDDPQRESALRKVAKWIEDNLDNGGE